MIHATVQQRVCSGTSLGFDGEPVTSTLGLVSGRACGACVNTKVFSYPICRPPSRFFQTYLPCSTHESIYNEKQA
jgi:hypothetical protein